ncbi:MAG: kelch repeat-containing protein [Candidatus Eisenbacteria bacterium]
MFFYGGGAENASYHRDGTRIDFETGASALLEWYDDLPGPALDFNLLLDRTHERLVLLGIPNGASLRVYSYDFSAGAWSSDSSVGAIPVADVARTAVIDAANDRVISLAGGERQMTLSGTPTWSALSPTGTAPPSLEGTAVMDSVRQRVLLFRDDMTVWALSLGAQPEWTAVFTAGVAPASRTRHTVTLDAERDRALLCGGTQTAGDTTKADVWAFDFASDTWQLLFDPGPWPEWRQDHTAVLAPELDAMLVFGGFFEGDSAAYLWPLEGAPSGHRLSPSGTPPSVRRSCALAYDRSRNRAYVFGGSALRSDDPFGDLWSLSLGDAPSWTQIAVAGGPSARYGSTAFWDPVRDRLIVVGGVSSMSSRVKTDIWALTLSGTPTWQQLLADSTTSRLGNMPVAVYDSLRDRIVLVATPTTSGVLRAWSFDLSASADWVDLGATGFVGGTLAVAGTLDTGSDRVWLHGGWWGHTGWYSAQLAYLSLGANPTFSTVSLANAPLPRQHHTLTYDPRRHRCVLYGGRECPEGGEPESWPAVDLQFLQGDFATPALASLAAAEVEGGAARLEWLVAEAAYTTWRVERSLDQTEWADAGVPISLGSDRLEFRDAGLPEGAHVGYRLVAIEGGVERRMGEVWITVPAARSVLQLSHVSFGGGSLRYTATLPGGGDARLAVYDVNGRAIGGTALGGLRGERQGAIVLRTPGRPGVYFVRLSQGGHAVTRKVLRLD